MLLRIVYEWHQNKCFELFMIFGVFYWLIIMFQKGVQSFRGLTITLRQFLKSFMHFIIIIYFEMFHWLFAKNCFQGSHHWKYMWNYLCMSVYLFEYLRSIYRNWVQGDAPKMLNVMKSFMHFITIFMVLHVLLVIYQ